MTTKINTGSVTRSVIITATIADCVTISVTRYVSSPAIPFRRMIGEAGGFAAGPRGPVGQRELSAALATPIGGTVEGGVEACELDGTKRALVTGRILQRYCGPRTLGGSELAQPSGALQPFHGCAVAAPAPANVAPGARSRAAARALST